MPEISVIMSSYNAASTLPAALEALAASTFDLRRVEVILVDDGSTDDTASIVDAYRKKLPLVYLLRDRRNGFGAGVARNAGLEIAKGRIMALTDADCIPDPNWLECIHRRIVVQGAVLVSGETWCDEIALFPWKMSPAGKSGITANLAYDAAKSGKGEFDLGFQGLYGDDIDFVLRMRAAGVELTCAPEVRVHHPVRRMSVRQVLTRAAWRKNEVLLHKKWGARADSSIHPFFRPAALHVSPATMSCVALAGMLVAVTVAPATRLPFLVIASTAMIAFFLGGYRLCIFYVPAGRPSKVTWGERAKTLVTVVAYLPCFVVARIKGSLEFRTPYL